MVDLSVMLAGVKCRTPIGVQPTAPIQPGLLDPERHADLLLRTVDAGAGYVVIPAFFYSKELSKQAEEMKRKGIPMARIPGTRVMKVETPGFGIDGFCHIGYTTPVALTWLEGAPRLTEKVKRNVPRDVPVIVNLIGPGADLEGWANAGKRCEELGADLIELNLSSPMPFATSWAVDAFFTNNLPSSYVGALVQVTDFPNKVGQVTKAVVDAVRVPVGVKISPETGFPELIRLAKTLKEAGASFITAINMAYGYMPPDIFQKGKPLWPYLDGNPGAGIHGNCLRLILYKYVAEISRHLPALDVIATGGLMTPEHFIESIMFGAKATGTCTGVYCGGISMIRKSIDFLEKYMENQGYASIEDFRGMALKYIKDPKDINWRLGEIRAMVNEGLCNGCGACIDTICLASYLENGIAKIRRDDCNGCGICVIRCPMGARRIVDQ